MNVEYVCLGVCAGAAGGIWHLLLTRYRTGLALRHGAAAALLTLPFALAGPAVAVLLAAQAAPLAAWLTLLGLFLVRLPLLWSSPGS